jgi:hypothetical protein
MPILDFRKAWATDTKLAGVPGRLFHSLRSTAVRNMIRAGVPDVWPSKSVDTGQGSMLDGYNIAFAPGYMRTRCRFLYATAFSLSRNA